jgi:hypothetical protein
MRLMALLTGTYTERIGPRLLGKRSRANKQTRVGVYRVKLPSSPIPSVTHQDPSTPDHLNSSVHLLSSHGKPTITFATIAHGRQSICPSGST